jgi:hypothetical protein
MCLFTSALRASVNKSHIPSLPQNNLYSHAKRDVEANKGKLILMYLPTLHAVYMYIPCWHAVAE